MRQASCWSLVGMGPWQAVQVFTVLFPLGRARLPLGFPAILISSQGGRGEKERGGENQSLNEDKAVALLLAFLAPKHGTTTSRCTCHYNAKHR